MTSSAALKAQAKYDQKNTKQIALKMNLKHDADILGKLESISNIQGYIKKLIRDNMRSEFQILPLETIRFLVLPTAKKYDFSRIYLFGSYARGEAKDDSDIDIFIEGGNMEDLNDYQDALNDLETATGKRVDLVMSKAVERDQSRAGVRFREHIEKDKVLIYEKS